MLQLLDYIGVIVFAITGCLVAARKHVDIVGFIWLATVTAVGGGTVRDLILNRPVFWVTDVTYIWLCLATAILMFFVAHWINRHIRLILWLDAVGLALFAVIGTQISIISGCSPTPAILLGIMTATLGGVFRDMLAREATLIMRREIYVSAAALSSVIFILLIGNDVSYELATFLAIIPGFLLRAAALRYRLQLPGYKWLKQNRNISYDRRH
jgi:uncharacterized membrane protein YeiH